MNKQSRFTAAPLPMTGSTSAGVPCSPVGTPANPIDAASRPGDHPGRTVNHQTGGAGASNASTLCPDCNSSLSYRIRDEDTGCFYPVDDGEHYCDSCDAIWSDDDLVPVAYPMPAMTHEEAMAKIRAVFPTGWLRAELSHGLGGVE